MTIRLLAPAGSFEALHAAIAAGADAIYFGVGDLNMRSRSANFAERDLAKIAEICKKNRVISCLTLNIIVYNTELEKIKKIIITAKKVGINAIIACDMAVIQCCKEYKIPVHISTQANVSNKEAVRFYAQYADVIVLARELSLDQIKDICNWIKKEHICGPSKNLVQIEIFVHGALCVSISGKCYMSLALYNTSANKGACYQQCRRAYTVRDQQTDAELAIDNQYVMSPKDLCTITFLDKILASGVSVLKVEGRGRSPEYVSTVVQVYRQAIDSITEKKYTEEKKQQWIKELAKVYNRGFWQGGYYLGKKFDEWSNAQGSKATQEKIYCGIVDNYYPKIKVAFIRIDAEEIHLNESLLIIGPTTGVVPVEVMSMKNETQSVTSAIKGEKVTLSVPQKVRKNDKVYLLRNKSILL
ncbi:MAG: peptidase U32 family protein [Candidatus Woesearchaeota archaeon]|jgi:putative protease